MESVHTRFCSCEGGAPRGTPIRQEHMHIHIFTCTYKFKRKYISDGVNTHTFLVKAVRHAAHEFDKSSPLHSPDSAPRLWEREIPRFAANSTRSSPSFSPPVSSPVSPAISLTSRSQSPQPHASHTHTYRHAQTPSTAVSAVTHVLSSILGAGTTNKLQHTATHCNTLQHTATHCNSPFICRTCAQEKDLSIR